MTSPSAPGVILPPPARDVHGAFHGRVARADNDPHTAIQQLRALVAAPSAEAPITGYCADLGPWNRLRSSHPTTWFLWS